MSSSYNLPQLLLEYIKWHYSRGFNELIIITRNFFGFLMHFFSFKLLLKTFFSPWKRMGEHYKKGLHIEETLSTLLVNLIMRAVGVVSRLVVVISGTLVLIVFMIISFATSVIWLLIPLLLISLFLAAFFLIYASI